MRHIPPPADPLSHQSKAPNLDRNSRFLPAGWQSVGECAIRLGVYFFQEPLVDYIVEVFKSHQFNDPAEGDRFFGLFGPGNTTVVPDRPFERFRDYEDLLFRLQQADPDKYKTIHKGTPFGFLSWLAFDLRNYEKALFYLDAGISEDVRKANPPESWINNPGPRVLLLDVDPNNVWFRRTVLEWKRILQRELMRFNAISGGPALDLSGSWQSFLRKLTEDSNNRTIISATYVFLLEFEDRWQELRLRAGSRGGSTQPFTVHLFTGGLLFESLLKYCYPLNDSGDKNRKLEGIWRHTSSFQRDFSLGDEVR